MAKQIVVTLAKIKDNPSNAEIVNQYNIQSGSGAVRIQAVDDIYYHLTDTSTNFAPENIMAQRVGNDLHVAFEGENIANPDLIIENYYQLNPNGHKNLLIGMHENGSFYPYVPESAQAADAVHLLAEHVAAGQALGGESFAAIVPWVAGGAAAAALNPFAIIGGIAGLGLVGGAIAASNNRSKNNDNTNTPPPPGDDGTNPPPPPPPPGDNNTPPPPPPGGGGTNPPPGGGTNPPNVKPNAADDTAQGTAGQPVVVDVLGNDTDPQGNNTLDPTSVKLLDPAGNPVTSLVVPNEGTWSVDPASGEVTFTPEAGFTGNPSSVQYTVADKDKNVSAPASITVTYSTSPQVGGVSSPSVTEGEALVYEVSMDAPAQATVVELQLVRGAGVEDSDLGAVEVSTDGGNTWTVVQPDAQGKFTATVPANSDKGVQVRVATVDDSAVEQGEELTLNAGVAGQAPLSGVGSIADNDTANTPPSAVSDTYEVNEDTPVDLNPLQGDSDPENDTLTVTHINGEALTGGAQTIVVPNGKVEVDASGKLTFVPNANFSGETSFSYTITDGHGNSDTAEQIINVKDVNNSPIVDSVTSPMSLSEEGLPGGLADTLGIVDTTNDRIGNGTLRFTDVDSSNFTLSMTGPASVTSGGETISWTWDSNTLMGSKPDGTLVMTVLMSAPMADGNGAYHADYTVSLLQPIDHPNKGEEDVLALKFGVTVSDNDNNSVVTELVVNVEDDMPTIGADTSVDMTLNKVAIHTNLLVALDLSHSMAAQDNGDPLSRFEHVKNALKAVVDKYDGAGDVAVNLVVFGTNAIPKTNGWVTVAQIKSIIDGLSLYPQGPEGYTNYEAALEKMMEAYANSTGKITKPGTQDISVFLTDGLPSAALGGDGTMQGQIIYGSEGGESNLGIDPAEEAIWKTWLINNKVKSYAYAVGAEVGNDANKAKAHMNPIAYDGKADTDMDGQVSPNAGSLLHAMDKDVDLDAAAIPGNGTVFTGTVNGGFGADAGHVRSVTIGGVTYSYDTVNNQITNDGNTDIINGNQVVIVTPQGGKLTLNMQSGEYTYLPDQSKTQYQENLSFGITDGDGDGKTSNQTWNIVVNPAVGAYDDKLKGTSNSAAIDADMLGWKGEYYGYNDNQIDNRVAENTNFAANARYHADDKSSGNNTISGNNLYTLDFAEKLINGRNGSTVTGSSRSADLGTPDARFNVSKIHYAETTLVDNEKTAPGEQVDNNSGLYRFLEKHGASDGSSIIVEAGVAYNNSAGLGYTTDAAMRFVGNVYFAKGVYDFGLIVDNAAILRIDGKEVVTQGTYSSSRIDSLERYPNGFEITEGVHSVEIIYIEENVNSALHMQYKLHDADDSTYQTLGLDNILMLKPEISLDLNGLQDIQQNGSAWEVRTGSILDGGSGNDVIEGSEARDFVFGGTGNDELSGNGAADTFIFSTQVGNGNDVIKDFTIGEDKIALTQLLEIEGQINPANPDWQGKDSVRNLHWNDADKVLTFTTADGEQNSITFENMTKSYASLDDFLKDNSFIA